MAMQLRLKRRQLPMHPLRQQLHQLRLRQQIVLHEDHEDVVEEMTDEEEQEVDDHDEADDKNERNQNLNKKSSVSDE
jgi:hypothetical protein